MFIRISVNGRVYLFTAEWQIEAFLAALPTGQAA